jgi:hypothetical protein
MTFKPGNKWGAGRKDKPFRDALMMEIKAAGDDFMGLRLVARALMKKANEGDVPAIREVADRSDGKVPSEAKIETGPLTSMSDDELASLIEAVNLLRDSPEIGPDCESAAETKH